MPTTATYRPTNDEEFMNQQQQDYFRAKLELWKLQLLQGADMTLNELSQGNTLAPDLVDRASEDETKFFELRTRDRARKLIKKIDQALQRLDDGSYGFCEEAGEPIGLKRLEARPTATLSLEAQEAHERHERSHRDE